MREGDRVRPASSEWTETRRQEAKHILEVDPDANPVLDLLFHRTHTNAKLVSRVDALQVTGSISISRQRGNRSVVVRTFQAVVLTTVSKSSMKMAEDTRTQTE